MPIGGKISESSVSAAEIPKFRRQFFVGWVLVVGIFPWILWWNPGAKSELQFQMFSIEILVILTIVSVPIGWIFGYKLLFAPLFCGVIYVNEPKK